MGEDREVFLAACAQNGQLLSRAPASLLADREVVLAAVSQCGRALLFAPEQLRRDADVALAALAQSERALQYVDASLYESRDFVLGAVRSRATGVLRYALPELCADRELMLEAIAADWSLLELASPELRADAEVVSSAVLSALPRSGDILRCADSTLLQDRAFMLRLVSRDGRLLGYASPELCADFEVASAAVTQCHTALEFVHESLQERFCIAATTDADRATESPVARATESPEAIGEISLASNVDECLMCEPPVPEVSESWKRTSRVSSHIFVGGVCSSGPLCRCITGRTERSRLRF